MTSPQSTSAKARLHSRREFQGVSRGIHRETLAQNSIYWPAKVLLERWLFVPLHEAIEQEPYCSSVAEHTQVCPDQPLAEDQRHDSDVHRIADVPVESGYHQSFGGSDWRGGTESFDGEATKGIEQNEDAGGNQHGAQ